ncbi:MAG: PHP domain-containing protein [Chloroflexi bacterium]|nr:PHP domain-containing protein [Chloroflexota bacterium]
MGKAILHVHSTFSDGMCTVGQLLDAVEESNDIDVVGITDHDDCRSYQAALDWKAQHPGSRVQPIWGTEITTFGFTHVLAYKMKPPFQTVLPRKFQPLRRVVDQLNDEGCYVVVPHVDAPMVGMNRSRLARISGEMSIFGYELLTPYFTSDASLPHLQALGDRHGLTALGGSDAHFIEDLYRVILHFPGDTVSDFARSWDEHTVVTEVGHEGTAKSFGTKLRQQRRSLIGHPAEQVRAWVRARLGLGATP